MQALVRSVLKYKKRDCFRLLQQFISRDIDGKICILYGLRRTGKTTLLFQMISELPVEQTAYIKIKTTDNMSKLTKDLEALNRNGCKYVFIDEITLMEDFINTAAVLSDIFRAINLVSLDYQEQIGIFYDAEKNFHIEALDKAIEEIRSRYGYHAIRNATLLQNPKMPSHNATKLIMPTGVPQ